jgi:hypothetical protein
VKPEKEGKEIEEIKPEKEGKEIEEIKPEKEHVEKIKPEKERLILLCQIKILASDHVDKYNVMC